MPLLFFGHTPSPPSCQSVAHATWTLSSEIMLPPFSLAWPSLPLSALRASASRPLKDASAASFWTSADPRRPPVLILSASSSLTLSLRPAPFRSLSTLLDQCFYASISISGSSSAPACRSSGASLFLPRVLLSYPRARGFLLIASASASSSVRFSASSPAPLTLDFVYP